MEFSPIASSSASDANSSLDFEGSCTWIKKLDELAYGKHVQITSLKLLKSVDQAYNKTFAIIKRVRCREHVHIYAYIYMYTYAKQWETVEQHIAETTLL